MDETIADCPFAVTRVAAKTPTTRSRSAKKRKRDGEELNKASEQKELVQLFPFEPPSLPSKSMDLIYAVEPSEGWKNLTRYHSFKLNGEKYLTNDFVYVTNAAASEGQKTTGENTSGGIFLMPENYWVAKILEVRAADENHVYARVYWMYWPDELLRNTLDGTQSISGRQPYHGRNELVASNHMDIINVLSVAMKATVRQWIESDDDEVQDALYWRQAFNCLTSQISSAMSTCKCRAPAHPDKTLIGCTNPDCGEWIHDDCLLHDRLMRVYERLGIVSPHNSNEKKPLEAVKDPVRRPLSPVESNGDNSTPSAMAPTSSTMTKLIHLSYEKNESTPDAVEQVLTPEPTIPAIQRSAKKKGRPKKAVHEKPYEGLFEASLKFDEGPLVWEITDLRTGVSGGARTWTEPVECLVCNAKMK